MHFDRFAGDYKQVLDQSLAVSGQDSSYFAEYKAGKLSYKPDWVVNDPIDLRFGKENRMFLKRADGKELEVLIVKRVRQ